MSGPWGDRLRASGVLGVLLSADGAMWESPDSCGEAAGERAGRLSLGDVASGTPAFRRERWRWARPLGDVRPALLASSVGPSALADLSLFAGWPRGAWVGGEDHLDAGPVAVRAGPGPMPALAEWLAEFPAQAGPVAVRAASSFLLRGLAEVGGEFEQRREVDRLGMAIRIAGGDYQGWDARVLAFRLSAKAACLALDAAFPKAAGAPERPGRDAVMAAFCAAAARRASGDDDMASNHARALDGLRWALGAGAP